MGVRPGRYETQHAPSYSEEVPGLRSGISDAIGRVENTEKAGGSRFSAGKPGGHYMIPLMGLNAVARVSTYGADKYAPYDWQQGQSFSTLLNCLWRHLLKAMTFGLRTRDEESGELHLAHAAWNLLAILHFLEVGEDRLDDVDCHRGKTATGVTDV